MTRIGILGGGQLGRMLLQAAANYAVETYVLEKDANCPAAALCNNFVAGDIQEYERVIAFGRAVDVLTIEIEHVNIAALQTLEGEGKRILPRPAVLATIQDKGLQKEFYKQHGIATADFLLTENIADVERAKEFLPAVHKLRKGGYDGKGVKILHSKNDLAEAFDEPAVLEKLVEVEKELAVIVARDELGNMKCYPPTEMVFDPQYNLVDYLISPATIDENTATAAQQLAKQVVAAFGCAGIFAVELFLDKAGTLLVNEVAPRAHNSGHQTIEGNITSQYDMQLRLLQKMPLGSTATILPSLMLNLIGSKGFSGHAKYEGLADALKMEGVYVHLYGKMQTKPGRKMGHLTIVGRDVIALREKAALLKKMVRVVA